MSGVSELPDHVPARMVNEFAYCPRLFYLEWVDKQWADNIETAEGNYHHRAVDEGGGAVPDPAGDEPVRVARSVRLSSDALGLTAVVDLLEGSPDGTVVPVDTKRGKVPDTPEQAWEPERVQMCVQGMLLNDAGYDCDYGVLYFADARRRVRVDFDEALTDRTRELLERLLLVARADLAPPPLIDSPKCPRCSLVGICLPDETNTLIERSRMPPRRLVPSASAARPLYLTEQGAYLGKKGGRVEIRKSGETIASVRLIDVSQVCVIGNAQVGSQVLRELFAKEIPVAWFSYGGWFSGLAEGLPAKNVELRRRQVLREVHGSVDIAREMVRGKILNARKLLMRNARERPDRVIEQMKNIAEQCRDVTSTASLLGLEGTAARLYFSAFETMLSKRPVGPQYSFESRRRRPPPDPVNALLGFVYGLIVKDLTIVSRLVGFDPYLGFYHRPRFGRPALALDLAEEFRSLVAESVVLQVLNNGEVTGDDFLHRAGSVSLTRNGRRAVIRAYERRLDHEITHPMFGYRASYRRLLEVQTRLLAAHVLGEVSEYTAFTTR